jgi:senataxin
MKSFLARHKDDFNQSQLEALHKVSDMHTKDLLLIQGPPGTGKTHTIHGIVSMLISSQPKKILVCTPSNSAIDEIVLRLTSDASAIKFGQRKLMRKGVLRIGAMDYEPLEQVKMHTLDYRLAEAIKSAEFGLNKDCTQQE